MRLFAAVITGVLFAVSAGLAGCASAPPLPPATAFDPKSAAYVHAKGDGRVDGQAFLVLRNGQTRLAAGETIRLVPATAYARERFTALYRGRKFLPASEIPSLPSDPAYESFTRTTTATSSGHFRFDDVAPGEYFVAAQKLYRLEGPWLPQGGAMYESVTVKDQQTTKVVVVGR